MKSCDLYVYVRSAQHSGESQHLKSDQNHAGEQTVQKHHINVLDFRTKHGWKRGKGRGGTQNRAEEKKVLINRMKTATTTAPLGVTEKWAHLLNK